MKKILVLLLLGFVITACNKKTEVETVDTMVEKAQKQVKMMQPEDLFNLMNSEEIYTLVDVRQEIEFYYGFIPGSVNIPRGSLEFKIGSQEFWDGIGLYMPEKDEKIVLYCKKGQRGILAAETLGKLGYTNVYALDGGWKSWELAYPDLYEKDLDKLGGHSSAPASSGGC